MDKKTLPYFFILSFIFLLFLLLEVNEYIFFTGVLSSIIILIFSLKRGERNFKYPINFSVKVVRLLFTFIFFSFFMGGISLILFHLSKSIFLTLQPLAISILLVFVSYFLISSLPTGIPIRIILFKRFLPQVFVLLFLLEVGLFYLGRVVIRLGLKSLPFFHYFFLLSGLLIFIFQYCYYRKNFVIRKLKKSTTSSVPLLVLGVDAADWRFLTPLLKSGKLKFFDKLVKDGFSMPLDTFGRRMSPIIWSTIATGVSEKKHGISGFINPTNPSGMELFKSHDIRQPPFWLMANEMGKRSAVLNWMMNYPAYIIDGFMVGRFDGFDDDNNFYPEDMKDEFKSLVEIEKKKCEEDKLEERWLCERDRDVEILKRALKISLEKMEEENIEILALYTNLTDDLMHKFYQFYESKRFSPEMWHFDRGDVDKYKNVIFETYQMVDSIFSEMIDLDKYNVILLSDHGSRPRNNPLYSFDIAKLIKDLEIEDVNILDNTIWNSHIDIGFKGGKENGEKLVFIFETLKIFSKVELILDGDFPYIRLYHSFLTRFPSGKSVEFNGKKLSLDTYLKFVEMASGNHDPQGVFVVKGEGLRRGFLLPLLMDGPLSILTNFPSLECRLGKLLPLFSGMRMVGLLNPITTLDVTPLINIVGGIPVSGEFENNFILNIFERGVDGDLLNPMNYFSEIYPVGMVETSAQDEIYKKRLRDLGYIE